MRNCKRHTCRWCTTTDVREIKNKFQTVVSCQFTASDWRRIYGLIHNPEGGGGDGEARGDGRGG